MFMKLVPFDPVQVSRVPREPGVYIIYAKATNEPVYVGRSRRDIHDRLQRHVTRQGSRKVAEALSKFIPLEFEYQCMISVEQAESQLIKALGTMRFFNLRRETDPADWE
jgi:excinuclease UvrABC nuclease subunit